MAEVKDQFVELDLGYVAELAISGAVLVQTEDNTFLSFNANQIQTDGSRIDVGHAVVEFTQCVRTQFGHPNDEARHKHPRYEFSENNGEGIFEVLNSSWIQQIDRDNRYSFSNTTSVERLRHFVFTFHGSTFECVAVDIKLNVVNESYEKVFATITQRVLSE